LQAGTHCCGARGTRSTKSGSSGSIARRSWPNAASYLSWLVSPPMR